MISITIEYTDKNISTYFGSAIIWNPHTVTQEGEKLLYHPLEMHHLKHLEATKLQFISVTALRWSQLSVMYTRHCV